MITLRDLIDQYVVVDIQTKNELEHFKREIVPYKTLTLNHWPVKIDMNLLRVYSPEYYDCDLPENLVPKPLEIPMSKLIDTFFTVPHKLGQAMANLDKGFVLIRQIVDGVTPEQFVEKEMD